MEERGETAYKRVGTYDLFASIGQGSFATVYRGQHRTTKRVVAVKAIVRARLNQKLQENLEAEISIMKSLDHPNVVQLFEVQTTERHVYLMLEFCPGGDLMRVIRARGSLDEAQARTYLQQLALGLAHLRTRNLIHRDLKPQNLLLSSMAPNAVLKIADFGFARYMQQQDLAETLCGSPLYMAPEILRFQKYDAKADLWSVGAILYEMLAARPPYTGANHVQLLKNIDARDAPPLPSGISADAQALLGGLLQREPVDRLAFEQFFAHPFLGHPTAPLPEPAPDKPGPAPPVERGSPTLVPAFSAPSTPLLPPAARPERISGDAAASGFSLGAAAEPGGPVPMQAASPPTVPVSPAPDAMPISPAPAATPPQPRLGSPLELPAASHAPAALQPLTSQATAQTPSQGSSPSSYTRGSQLPSPLFGTHEPRPAALPSPQMAPMASLSPPQLSSMPMPAAPMPALHLTAPAQLQPGPAPGYAPPQLALLEGKLTPAPAPAEGTLLATSNALARQGSDGARASGTILAAGASLLPSSSPMGAPALAPGTSLAASAAARASRQIVSVPVAGGQAAAHGPVAGGSCPSGYGAHASAAYASHASLAPMTLPIHDASLDGIDQEYVLISTRTLAATLPPATTAAGLTPHGMPHGAECRLSPAFSEPAAPEATALPSALEAQQQLALATHGGSQQGLELAAQLARAAALADFAQESADGGPRTYGEGFSAVESLALHVKALATLQQCLNALLEPPPPHPPPQLPPPPAAGHPPLEAASPSEADARLEAIRVRFAELLQSAERIRSTLRAADETGNPTTVCVEELLYRHALGMGREAAVDELLGKLASSCVLYARAKLLLEQLALEPQVGAADRAVLCKYAAGFAWRLQEISQKVQPPPPRPLPPQ